MSGEELLLLQDRLFVSEDDLEYFLSGWRHQVNPSLLDEFDDSLKVGVSLVHTSLEFSIDCGNYPNALVIEQPEQERQLVDLGEGGEDIRLGEKHATVPVGAVPPGAPAPRLGQTSRSV